MKLGQGPGRSGVAAALAAALLFGAGTPLAKWLLAAVDPWLLAGLLYLGAGLGLALYRRLMRAPRVRLPRQAIRWLGGAILAGGIVGPVLLMIGLRNMSASAASLLLNAESALTAGLAWFVFKENVDKRIALGMAAMVAGAVVLSWPAEADFAGWLPAITILGACFAWAIDNNLTRNIALSDATWIASVKGLVAGGVNLVLALSMGAILPGMPKLATAMAVGLLAYGVSLTLFIIGLRHLGSARTGAYFSVAPFFGAVMAVLMGEAVTLQLLIAGALMAIGAWLHLTERHQHPHVHLETLHDHEHVHGENHQHQHEQPVASGTQHSHPHWHKEKVHSHPHFPDAFHRHQHD